MVDGGLWIGDSVMMLWHGTFKDEGPGCDDNKDRTSETEWPKRCKKE